MPASRKLPPSSTKNSSNWSPRRFGDRAPSRDEPPTTVEAIFGRPATSVSDFLASGEIDMNRTYRAIEVTRPGVLNLVQRATSEPARDHVRIQVEACGVCHS